MLCHAGTRFELLLFTKNTGEDWRAVDLHVHVHIMLAVELSVVFSTCVGGRQGFQIVLVVNLSGGKGRRLICDISINGMRPDQDDTFLAERFVKAFIPLVATELAFEKPIATLRAGSPHYAIVTVRVMFEV